MSFPTEPVKLPYRYDFGPSEYDAAQACLREHGFAIARQVLPPDVVEALAQAVTALCDPDNTLEDRQSKVILDFVERHESAWRLMELPAFMAWHEHLLGAKELTIHRSACILRKPGSPVVAWHTDHSFDHTPPKSCNDALNNHDWPNGKWFYLTGSSPEHGGLAVIADSHRDDWTPPEGFQFIDEATRKSFHRVGAEPKWYADFDVPGCVPLFTDPGDLILFAAKTYHAAFENRSSRTRLSCAVGFRPRGEHDVPWDVPDHTLEFRRRLPDHLKPYAEHYTGIVPGWTPQTQNA